MIPYFLVSSSAFFTTFIKNLLEFLRLKSWISTTPINPANIFDPESHLKHI